MSLLAPDDPTIAGRSLVDRGAVRAHPLDGALLRFHPPSGLNVRVATAATAHLRRTAPRVAMFGITNACNLACDFCSRDVRRDSRWTVGSAAALLRGLSEAGTLEVAFGGGEPFAFRGFAELVAELHATTALALHVTTNGTLLGDAMFTAYAGRFGQVRVSIYDDPRWRAGCRVLARAGQRWGANRIVDDAALAALPALLAELAALGCRDVSLLAYVGPDRSRHLGPAGRSRLAELVADAPIACRLSVCFGDRVPAPRLFDGADGSGDCGAGLDFVSITPDQRMQGCSFHDGGFPASTAEEVLHAWRSEQARLGAASARDGCARRWDRSPRAAELPPIAVWQAFSGNNSGECVMVARFTAVEDAAAYVAELLPGYEPDVKLPPEWAQLFADEKVAGAPVSEWRETPRELVAIGRSVIAVGYDSGDAFPELRSLAWKRGAYVVPGGVHLHDGLWLLAAIRARDPADAKALAAAPVHPEARAWRHGDVVLVGVPLAELSVDEARELLAAAAGPRSLAAEILFEPLTRKAMLAVKKRLGAELPSAARLAVGFWGEEADEKIAAFARLVTDGEVTVAGGCALVSGIERRKRLAVLGYRRGASVSALDGAEVSVYGALQIPQPKRKGKRAEPRVIEADAFEAELRHRLAHELAIEVTPMTSWGYGPIAAIRTTAPELAMAALGEVASGLGVGLHVGVSEVDPLAHAVRRVIADLRG